MSKYHEILKQYWGYDKFRPMQEEIIESIGQGHDTLGLLPTGGGKSITFQVPAMAKPGICLVITPLVALMKDQVENLKNKGIKAYAVHSGQSANEIDTILNNCIFGEIKFLYLAPERIGTKIFRTRILDMNVNLIAVDEAHCISQWGYDFRPAYLKIANIRQLLPNVPVLALTATATKKVVEDIQDKLQFTQQNVFKKSFERKNLIYWVKESENKDNDLLRIVSRNTGSGIVYVRNRRKTKEVADFLQKNEIKADYYHAGLSPQLRDEKQNSWMNNTTKVIVSTNAFGMGIDKPDVRYVVHLDLPDSLEAYFQEAGRGGRDEKKSYAILLYNRYDRAKLRQNLSNSFPEIEYIREVYDNVCSHLEIPMGTGKGQSFNFEIGNFVTKYRYNAVTAINALKILEMEGYLTFEQDVNIQPRIKFIVDRNDLYKFQVSNLIFDAFIKLLLRSYTGLFQEYAHIDEHVLATKAQSSLENVREYLILLDKMKIIDYIPQLDKPQIVMIEERREINGIYISKEHYDIRKDNYSEKIEAAIRYAESTQICRSRLLLEYFGEKTARNCGECDICKNSTNRITGKLFDDISKQIMQIIDKEPITMTNLVKQMPHNDDIIVKTMQWLLDNNLIEKNGEQQYKPKKRQ